MILNYETYKDRVKACFIGKNIGGTMGGPYEWKRELLDVKGFTTPPGKPLPNDDLDLQLVWLHALEHLGPAGITASALGEFWLSFIHPGWNEYGIGKANMMRGILPPVSGDLDNNWQNSNGAWIRTEIWATTAPAIPEVAAKFAIEDAKIDHGAGEGTHAAAFVAAMQSAAFALSSLNACIEVGLAAIPEESRTAKSVRFVLDCYEEGKSWAEARNAVLALNADIGTGWFEAPTNVAFAVIGLIYGEGDFKKSMLTAINCGDDTDCTAATVGATMGILYGMKGIPEDWAAYIGDEIVTVSLAQGDIGKSFARSCTELTERIAAAAPTVLHYYSYHCIRRRYEKVRVLFGEEDIPEDIAEHMKARVSGKVKNALARLKPNTMHFKEAFLDAEVVLSSSEISPNGEVTVSLTLENDRVYDNMARPVSMRWLLPEGFTAEGRKNALLPRRDSHNSGKVQLSYTVRAGETVEGENRLILEVTSQGRHTALYISFVLIG